MRKLAIAALVLALLAIARKPAEARCGNDCPPFFNVVAWTFATAFLAGYAGVTGYFVYRDFTDDDQSLSYGGAELGVNAAFAAILIPGTIHEVRNGGWGVAAVTGPLAAIHTSLAVHGAWRVYQRRSDLRDQFRLRDTERALQWTVGLGYGLNTAIWAVQIPGQRHGRNYGIVEAAVNGPIALGFGYLAFDRARDDRTPQALLFGAMAAASAALTIHGVRTAISPTDVQLVSLRGAGLAPTVVSDGRDYAPGLAASGTW